MAMRSVVSVPESFEMSGASEGPATFPQPHPHQVETEVSLALRETMGIHVESLSIHQIEGGVCLHGVVEVDDLQLDVTDVVRRALGIDQVINRMIVRPCCSPRSECTSLELGCTGEWA